MAKDKEIKTNAIRILDKNKISYTTLTYECDEFIDGVTMVSGLGKPLESSFKTLVAQGKTRNYYVYVIPVAEELDMKKAAAAVGEKSVELIPVKDITNVTGYIRGGCTPIGMKKQYTTVVHNSAQDFERIMLSAGKIGVQMELNPNDLVRVVGGSFAAIVM